MIQHLELVCSFDEAASLDASAIEAVNGVLPGFDTTISLDEEDVDALGMSLDEPGWNCLRCYARAKDVDDPSLVFIFSRNVLLLSRSTELGGDSLKLKLEAFEDQVRKIREACGTSYEPSSFEIRLVTVFSAEEFMASGFATINQLSFFNSKESFPRAFIGSVDETSGFAMFVDVRPMLPNGIIGKTGIRWAPSASGKEDHYGHTLDEAITVFRKELHKNNVLSSTPIGETLTN